MPRGICASCETRATYKLASFYWAWRWPSGDRRAYVQLLCPHCTLRELLKFKLTADHYDQCLGCTNGAQYPQAIRVYATYYIPGRDRGEGEELYCETCFNKEEEMFIQNARRLPERGSTAGGPPPSTPAADPWAAAGIQPAG